MPYDFIVLTSSCVNQVVLKSNCENRYYKILYSMADEPMLIELLVYSVGISLRKCTGE